jgi:ribosomal protein L5
MMNDTLLETFTKRDSDHYGKKYDKIVSKKVTLTSEQMTRILTNEFAISLEDAQYITLKAFEY